MRILNILYQSLDRHRCLELIMGLFILGVAALLIVLLMPILSGGASTAAVLYGILIAYVAFWALGFLTLGVWDVYKEVDRRYEGAKFRDWLSVTQRFEDEPMPRTYLVITPSTQSLTPRKIEKLEKQIDDYTVSLGMRVS